MSQSNLTAAFGYDPNAGLHFIGTGADETGTKWEFYLNADTGAIDVCHFGCNGTFARGQVKPDGTTTLRPHHEKVFLGIRAALEKQEFIGTIDNCYHLYVDFETGRINGYMNGPARPNQAGYIKGVVTGVGTASEKVDIGNFNREIKAAVRLLLAGYRESAQPRNISTSEISEQDLGPDDSFPY